MGTDEFHPCLVCVSSVAIIIFELRGPFRSLHEDFAMPTRQHWNWLSCCIVLAAAGTGGPVPATAQEPRVTRDLEYARVGDSPLLLDLYVPPQTTRPPVVVWVHGGAWRSGSKKDPPLLPLLERGLAIASVDYRLSPVAKFPAQAHDLKAAIRFLRGKSSALGIQTERLAIAGGSAGGHLAALVGVSGGVQELEGDLGDDRSQSSQVQAIVAFYGASNLTTILAQSTPHGLSVRVPALELLLGGQPDARTDLARLASPVFHVDPSDPPLLWLHGDQDPQMPINQAHEMIGAYKKQGLSAELEVVYGGVHGGKLFYTPEQLDQVARFLNAALAPKRPAGKP
jgi:acetyl esterase/lipase